MENVDHFTVSAYVNRYPPRLYSLTDPSNIVVVPDKTNGTIDMYRNRMKSGRYYFDHVFDSLSTNEDLFRDVGIPIIDSCLRGINGTIYFGGEIILNTEFKLLRGEEISLIGNSKEESMINTCIEYLLHSLEKLKSTGTCVDYDISVQCMRFMKDTLINYQVQPGDHMATKEMSNHGTIVNGDLKTPIQKISCFNDFLRNIGKTINHERTVNGIQRGWDIFISFTIKIKEKVNGSLKTRKSHFNLIDIAEKEHILSGKYYGSDDVIRKSLLNHGCVICPMLLNDNKVNEDSLLYRILHEPFEKNSKVSLIISCDPFKSPKDGITRSLKFALECKKSAKRIERKRFHDLKNESMCNINILTRELMNIKNEIKVLVEVFEKQLKSNEALVEQLKVASKNTQNDIFEEIGRSLVDNCINGSIFSCEVDGKNKSHLFIRDSNGYGGLIYLCVKNLLSNFEQTKRPGIEYKITAKCMLLINNQLHNLHWMSNNQTVGLKTRHGVIFNGDLINKVESEFDFTNDSKETSIMTRLLHDSFKDDGKILIIAICDPTYECIEENISKINFVMNCIKASYEAMARNKYALIINFKNQFEILSKRMDGIKTENMHFKELL
uniref:Kinesin motor domain-containing protein n=1 Tax=Parastrongyloides trichosuri TaxID=131310 RepID=A0A0N4Z6Y0_PARTI